MASEKLWCQADKYMYIPFGEKTLHDTLSYFTPALHATGHHAVDPDVHFFISEFL